MSRLNSVRWRWVLTKLRSEMSERHGFDTHLNRQRVLTVAWIWRGGGGFWRNRGRRWVSAMALTRTWIGRGFWRSLEFGAVEVGFDEIGVGDEWAPFMVITLPSVLLSTSPTWTTVVDQRWEMKSWLGWPPPLF